MMLKPNEDGVVPGYWCVQTHRWIPTHRPDIMIDPPKTSGFKVQEVSTLEYLMTVSRAVKNAGLTLQVGHIDTAVNKLLNEQEIPKLRVIQILNNLSNAAEKGEKEVTISVADLRLILQSPRLQV